MAPAVSSPFEADAHRLLFHFAPHHGLHVGRHAGKSDADLLLRVDAGVDQTDCLELSLRCYARDEQTDER